MAEHWVWNTSDLHNSDAPLQILNYISKSNIKIDDFALIGDRSIDPDFSKTNDVNILREKKREILEKGGNYVTAEEQIWKGPFKDILIEQWLGILGPTKKNA